MNLNQFLKDYFTFTRKERVGIIVILVLILVVWFLPKFVPSKKPFTTLTDTTWISAARKLEHDPKNSSDSFKQDNDNIDNLVYEKTVDNRSNNSQGQLFYFDPNTLSNDGWKKLGISERTIGTIQKYLSKGGHFYKKEDLKKIYGFHTDEYERLASYIKIASLDNSVVSYLKKEEPKASDVRKNHLIDINAADTSEFISLPGIGSKLASRIVNFRNKLGGFYSIDQISEIYGLPDSTFQKIKPLLLMTSSSVKKININTASKDELKLHPYIKWNLANVIVEYRNQHGNYSSLEDLKKITLITDDIFDKIKFYLTF
jgi:competence ComEA-like helix-hairpin-helix protein